MEYRPLGRTGITVSHLSLGAMMLGAMGNTDRDECVRIVHGALDAGINTINTADGYSAGESEEILGEALADGRRDEVVLTVKTGLKVDGHPNHGGGSRRWLTQAIEGSLRRLRTDWIDVYELGVPDPDTDIDETLGALTDLVTAGKIRTFGASKMPPSQIAEARAVAERRGLGVFRVEESPYSMLNRAVEYDLLPTCSRLGIGVLAFGPLARGWLSGRYRLGSDVGAPGSSNRARGGRMDATAPANAAKLHAADALGALADDAGLTLPQLATAFVARHPAVSTVLIGPRTFEQLESSLTADGVDLSEDVLDRIDAIVPPGSTVDITDAMWEHGTRALDAGARRR
ncbi:aldo/keto reductase [uncultured Jatrophihabitans sp.]|uniref:aldo/keto reductase n=1 Tax=uncultured Jatrophihabitans sp. TaxID=1610747 RepID=UPI0035CC47C8